MRILIATGGTGGHLFPALSLAKQLDHEVVFIGQGLSSHPLFENCIDIPAGRRPLLIAKGVLAARKVVRDFDLVIGFGSWYTLPALIAAKLAGVPILLHEANAWPGRVNRLFSRWATTGIQFPETAKYLKGKSVCVEMPLSYPYRPIDQAEARKAFDLDPNRQTLLIFGGSQGADAFRHLPVTDWQVIHLYGNNPIPRYSQKAYIAPFEHRMELAYAAADLAITRAGAATCAELIEWKVPAILIPWPGASEDHQSKNADAMVKTGGAIKLPEAELLNLREVIDQARELRCTWQRPAHTFAQLVDDVIG